MNRFVSILVLLCFGQLTCAETLSPAQKDCVASIKEQVKFIIAGIESINLQYEQLVRDKQLEQFKSGEYSGQVFLDNSIRKYRLELTGEVKSYPTRYLSAMAEPKKSNNCMADQLEKESIGIIHHFETRWQNTIDTASRNRKFFQSVENLQ